MKIHKIISKSKNIVVLLLFSLLGLLMSGCSEKNCILRYQTALDECKYHTKFTKDETQQREQMNSCLKARGFIKGAKECD